MVYENPGLTLSNGSCPMISQGFVDFPPGWFQRFIPRKSPCPSHLATDLAAVQLRAPRRHPRDRHHRASDGRHTSHFSNTSGAAQGGAKWCMVDEEIASAAWDYVVFCFFFVCFLCFLFCVFWVL
jgi:hypothetical protein